MSLDEIVRTLDELIRAEQQLSGLDGYEDLETHRIRRRTIRQQLQDLEHEVKTIQQRVQQLPALPPMGIVHWAQYVRAMPNLVFLEVDTTGLQDNAEIIRTVLLNAQGQVVFDRIARPSQPLTDGIASITGITMEQIHTQAVPARDLLQQLQEYLYGKYLLSYNLEFDRGKLKDAARRLRLNEIQVIGEDLMIRAMQYFSLTGYPRLENLCERIGYRLPAQPHQTAVERARGQIALLNAMANVTMNYNSPMAEPQNEH